MDDRQPEQITVKIIEADKTSWTDGDVTVDFTTGWWRINNEFGKTLSMIKLTINSRQLVITFVPSETFQVELIRNWLEAEWRNDNYVFKNPLMGRTRPKQLMKKARSVQRALLTYLAEHTEDNVLIEAKHE